ncbi:MAG: MYG1 family protein [Myxococcota bacterium]|jgi:hypothetical protein|nr:MYG1 family protein [Myxococcota bacterium]
MPSTIVVHPGGAHMDEVLATGLIVHCHGQLTVERRRPTRGELQSADTWVVDIGGAHDPALLNFDHHQDDPAVADECALSLVARHLGLHELLSSRPWYPAQVTVDLRGSAALASQFGLEGGMPDALTSPAESGLLALWQAGGAGPVAPALVEHVGALAGALVDEARRFGSELSMADGRVQIRLVGGLPILFLERSFSEPVVEHLRRGWEEATEQRIAATVAPDSRDPDGLALDRFQGETRIDFRWLHDHPRIRFAHKSGFVAKTQPGVTMAEVEQMLARSVREPHTENS